MPYTSSGILITCLISPPSTLPCSHAIANILTCLFFQNSRHASWPLHFLFPWSGMFYSYMAHSLSTFRSPLKCYFLSKASLTSHNLPLPPITLHQGFSQCWFQDPFTLLKIEDPKQLLFIWVVSLYIYFVRN